MEDYTHLWTVVMDQCQARVVFVLEGTTEGGEAVVRSLLETGATVIVASTSKQRIKQLKKRLAARWPGFLAPLVANVEEASGARHIIEHIRRRFGKLDAVIAPFDGMWQTLSLADITSTDTASGLLVQWREDHHTKHLVSAWLEDKLPEIEEVTV